MAWQFPHFYGILYQHKEDYYNADFKMISDDDPNGKKAVAHLLISHLAMQGSVYGLWSLGVLPFWSVLFNGVG